MERFADRIQETTATVGTGSIALAGALAGFAAFSSIMSIGDTCTYVVVDPVTKAWETGVGTYTAANTLARTAVSSSIGGALLTLAGNAGTTISIGLTASIMRTVSRTLGQPQIFTASGAIDITKPLFVVLNSTTAAIVATLPSGTYDGQSVLALAYPAPAGIQHAITGSFFGASQSIPLFSPNIGASITGRWSTSLASWVLTDFIGGMETREFASAGPLTGAELLSLTQGGYEFSSLLTTLTAFVRQTPAGDRSVALTSGASVVALVATDHDRVIVASGTVAGTLTVDSAVPAGFRCTVINSSSGALTYGATTVAAGGSATMVKAGGSVFALTNTGTSGPSVATSLTFTQSATTGANDVLTVAPVGGVWPSGSFTLTATLSGGAAGSFGTPTGAAMSGGAITPTPGSSSVTVPFTATANGSVAFALTNTMGLSNPAGLTFTASGIGATQATSITLTQSATSGANDTLTIAPVGGVWPSGSFTLAATLSGGAAGSFGTPTGGTISGGAITPTAGSGNVTVPYTATANGSIAFALTNTMGLANPTGLTFTASGISTGGTPTFTFSTAAAYTSGAKFLSAGLSAGVGSAPIVLPSNSIFMGLWIKSTTTEPFAFKPFVNLSTPSLAWGLAFAFNNSLDAEFNGASQQHTYATINDGNQHYLAAYCAADGTFGFVVDGAGGSYGSYSIPAGSATISLDMTALSAGWLISELYISTDTSTKNVVPTGPRSRDSNTIALFPLVSNGTSL